MALADHGDNEHGMPPRKHPNSSKKAVRLLPPSKERVAVLQHTRLPSLESTALNSSTLAGFTPQKREKIVADRQEYGRMASVMCMPFRFARDLRHAGEAWWSAWLRHRHNLHEQKTAGLCAECGRDRRHDHGPVLLARFRTHRAEQDLERELQRSALRTRTRTRKRKRTRTRTRTRKRIQQTMQTQRRLRRLRQLVKAALELLATEPALRSQRLVQGPPPLSGSTSSAARRTWRRRRGWQSTLLHYRRTCCRASDCGAGRSEVSSTLRYRQARGLAKSSRSSSELLAAEPLLRRLWQFRLLA